MSIAVRKGNEMETMKRRTKAAKRKKTAGTQKVRDMIAALVVGNDVEEREQEEAGREARIMWGDFISLEMGRCTPN